MTRLAALVDKFPTIQLNSDIALVNEKLWLRCLAYVNVFSAVCHKELVYNARGLLQPALEDKSV